MPRPATGAIETYEWADGVTVTYRARVRAYGQRYRLDLGTNHEGWSPERARVELDRIVAAIARGTWEPPTRKATVVAPGDETLHVTASRWWARKRREIDDPHGDYRWRLDHLLRYEPHTPTAWVDARWVDGFRDHLLEQGLAPRSANMVLGVLAQVLDDAVRYELLDVNPARAKGTRVRQQARPRTWLDAGMVVDLLDAAGEWEASLPPHQRYGRRAFLATLALAGPRIEELTKATRGNLDLHTGVVVLGSKTEAGRDRRVDLTAFLLGELRAHLAGVPARLRGDHLPSHPIFPTSTGGRLNASNVRNRLLAETVRRANEKRAREGRMLLPHTTPHTLRRTFASLCAFAGRDPRWVMGQLGHADPRVTLGIYQQTMNRRDVDHELVGQLMRFADEEEHGHDRGVSPVRPGQSVGELGPRPG